MSKRTFLFLVPVVVLCLVGVWSAFRGSRPDTPSGTGEVSGAPRPVESPVALTAPPMDGVTLMPDRILCSGGAGEPLELKHADLNRVSFLTRGAGTKAEETRWMLVAANGACEFPSITPGAEDLVSWFHELPEFSYRTAIDAMTSPSDGEVVVWSK